MAMKYFTITIVLLITFTYTASAATIDIGTNGDFDFSSIQDAIDYSSEGDTIRVHPETYTENVIVNKKLTIISSSGRADDVILIAKNSSKPVIHIVSDCVTINGLKITGSYDKGGSGIYLENADECIIKNNNVSDNNFAGIILEYSSDNEITSNSLLNDSQGIYLDHSLRNTLQENLISNNKYGIYLHVSKKNVIDKNEITGNNAGITQGLSNSNTIVNNVVSKNNGGFFLYKSNENQIKNNTLSSNNEHGILLRYSDSNTLESNIVNGSNSGIRIVDYSTNNAIINNCLSGNGQDIIANELENTIVASADDNNPDNDNKNNNSLVHSHGDIKYVMLFGNYSSPITIEDVEKATVSVLESSQKEKSKPVITTCTKPGTSSEIILAYCISADENGVTSTYTGKTSIEDESKGERTIEIIHGKAQEWYEKEVLGMKLNPDEEDVMDTSSDIIPEKKEVISTILPAPDHFEDYATNNYGWKKYGSIYNQEWIPDGFPLLM